MSYSPRLACNLVYAHLAVGLPSDARDELDAALAHDPELEGRLRALGIGVAQ